MERWYVKTEEEGEIGPYSLKELEELAILEPFSLVRLETEENWRPAWEYPALRKLFVSDDEKIASSVSPVQQDFEALVLEAKREPPQFIFWILALLLLLCLKVYFQWLT
ncbi:MAG: hypothetical protein CMO81_11240 [Waddliaceae bacterium]|nr:hypothetical protein [Waddliaceae bacterium]